MSDNLKIIGTVWLTVVISVLSIFCLCKLGGTWFNLSANDTRSVQERMYDDCLNETNGHNTNNCNMVLKEVK